MPIVKTKDGNFYAAFDILSPLELLDLDVSDDDNESFVFASEVALAVTDWNGLGKVDPLFLVSDRTQHQYVYLVSQAIDKKREPIPKLKVLQQPDGLKFQSSDGFQATLKDLTILEFMDYLGNVRKTNGDELKSLYKCIVVANILIDWNGKGQLNADQLCMDRKNHKYIIAIDNAMSEFFRVSGFTVFDNETILDDSDHNGRNDPESASVESQKNSGKRVAFHVVGV